MSEAREIGPISYVPSDTPAEAHAKGREIARREGRQTPAPRAYNTVQRKAWDAGWHFEKGAR